MVKVAWYCPLVRGTVTQSDCAHCSCFREDDHDYADVNECRSENLVAGYECSECKSFGPPGATLDARGNLLCPYCVMNERSTRRLPRRVIPA